MNPSSKTSQWPSGKEEGVGPASKRTLAMTLYAALLAYMVWAAFGCGF